MLHWRIASPPRERSQGSRSACRRIHPAGRVKRSLAMNLFRHTLVAVTIFSGVAHAQYAINWFTLDGGGGTSTGGNYTLSGTIGQPDTGMLSGGTYTLQGGFWPGLIVPSTGEAPTLFIQQSGMNVVISWAP